MITFIVHHMGVQGSYLNHLDMRQYLKDDEGHQVQFYCENVKRLFEVIKKSRRNYTFEKGEVKLLRGDVVDYDTVITDFKTLISLREKKINVICEKLIVMDTIELTYHLKGMTNARFYYDVDIRDLLRGIYSSEVVFLMPDTNAKLFSKVYPDLTDSCKPFYKHININVLNTIECGNKDGYFYRWDTDEDDSDIIKQFGDKCVSFPPTWTTNKKGVKVPLKYNESDHLFDYKNLVYRRRKYLAYEEQFGRLIFEYILLGKTVYFANETHTEDGLTDYLTHFDIRFCGRKIITSKEELAEKMGTYNDRPWL